MLQHDLIRVRLILIIIHSLSVSWLPAVSEAQLDTGKHKMSKASSLPTGNIESCRRRGWSALEQYCAVHRALLQAISFYPQNRLERLAK